MPRRAVLLTLTALLAACDAPPREPQTSPPATPPARTALKAEPVDACGPDGLERFRRDWSKGASGAAENPSAVTFRRHFNAKLDTCFMLVSISAGVGPEKRMLYDAATGELYGEYLGPASESTPHLPKLCRVESLYCASRGEWDVLVGPYMTM